MNVVELQGTKASLGWHTHTTWAYVYTQCTHIVLSVYCERSPCPRQRGVLLLYVILPRWGGWQVSVVKGTANPWLKRFSDSVKLTHYVYHGSMSPFNPLNFSVMLIFCHLRCENNVKHSLTFVKYALSFFQFSGGWYSWSYSYSHLTLGNNIGHFSLFSGNS